MRIGACRTAARFAAAKPPAHASGVVASATITCGTWDALVAPSTAAASAAAVAKRSAPATRWVVTPRRLRSTSTASDTAAVPPTITTWSMEVSRR